jgi:hypothetical protein
MDGKIEKMWSSPNKPSRTAINLRLLRRARPFVLKNSIETAPRPPQSVAFRRLGRFSDPESHKIPKPETDFPCIRPNLLLG